MTRRARVLSLADYVDGIRAGDRAVLGRALTLVESSKDDDRELAQRLLAALGPGSADGHRVGISGVPGVGKSTLIETLGMSLTKQGHRVAVLAVDPSSTLSGGSILGDKTRMTKLANEPRAFIRPSPSALTLGGVARRTRESMLLCEAAGYDVVLVETVGVGQSETAVSEMVDSFVVLMLPGAGDELQGIKRGILELADIVAVNKADGDNVARARDAKREYSAALRYWPRKNAAWSPEVHLVSGLSGDGLDALWTAVERHRKALSDAGELDSLRQQQRQRWMWAAIEDGLMRAFRNQPGMDARIEELEQSVADGDVTPTAAADELLARFRREPSS